MNDSELRKHILDELEFDPSLDAAHIGVAVENGVATLTGHVASYAQKYNAERATQRVKGDRAVAQEIEVRLPSASPTDDDQVAKRALDIIAWDTTLPANAIKYVRRVEELIGAPVALLSTSPDRDDTIMVQDPFVDR